MSSAAARSAYPAHVLHAGIHPAGGGAHHLFPGRLARLQRGAVLLFSRAHRDQFARIADVMVDKVGSYMIGNILISLIAGVAAFAALTALTALGLPFAVPLAFLVAVTDLIPLIGATLGAVIIAVALFATRLWPTTVLVLVFFVVTSRSRTSGSRRGSCTGRSSSAATVLLAGLIGGAATGLIGALMAIPIAAGIKVLLSERLQARDAADAGAAALGDGETAPQPGQADSHTLPPPDRHVP